VRRVVGVCVGCLRICSACALAFWARATSISVGARRFGEMVICRGGLRRAPGTAKRWVGRWRCVGDLADAEFGDERGVTAGCRGIRRGRDSISSARLDDLAVGSLRSRIDVSAMRFGCCLHLLGLFQDFPMPPFKVKPCSGIASYLPSTMPRKPLTGVFDLTVAAWTSGELLGDVNGWDRNFWTLRRGRRRASGSSLSSRCEDGDDVCRSLYVCRFAYIWRRRSVPGPTMSGSRMREVDASGSTAG